MLQVRSVATLAGHGIVGDCNAQASSPRQVLLVSRRSLQELGLYETDLRPNLVLDEDLSSAGSGAILNFDGLRLRITIPCEPCGKLNEVRTGLSGEIGSRRGLLARVLSTGVLRLGARGAVEPIGAEPLATNWKTRVRHIVVQVPAGKVITYGALATLAGVQMAYCRALPSVLRSICEPEIPIHRVVPTDAKKISAGHMRKLLAEGADIREKAIPHWDGALYYSNQESTR
jgi:alkylated DNA nucleotide flippase Atl1